MKITDVQVRSYIKKALENETFVIKEIILSDFSKGGFVSNVLFATVLGTTEENIQKNIEVAIKISRNDLIQTHNYTYKREAYVYNTVIPKFNRYQTENNIKNIFDSIPKCYKTIPENDVQVIVMENLAKSGYVMHDCMKPLDLGHLKLVLQEFGKLHAISFALREKRKGDFEKLSATYSSIWLQHCDEKFRTIIQQRLNNVCDILEEVEETKLYEMCDKILEKGADNAIVEMLETVEPQSAILHGDCWNNIFLFKYKHEDNELPSKVAFVDWRFSSLHSPVLDLSYFIYTTCSEQELKHFDELLHTYHTSFSYHLKEFGCDAEKIFSFSDLQRHWKKYSLYGILMVTTLLHLPLCVNANNIEINESDDEEDLKERIASVQEENEIEYRKRLIAVLNHYYKHNYK